MKRIRLLVSTLALGLALLPLSASASTLTTYHESVRGVETGFPQSSPTCPSPGSASSFAGVAVGTLSGGFAISVCHTAIGPGGAKILSGAFTISNAVKTVRGVFKHGGAVLPLSQQVNGASCVQRFGVTGYLLPSGLFGGKLTHYGVWTGSSCNVFFATISGNATLTA